MTTPLPFTAPFLLAPMEGVTEPVFRELVLERNPPSHLGGAFTEFVRVSTHALPRHVLERHLGERRFPQPVGLQIMGSDPVLVAETARRAVQAGAPLIDLNFGCPSKGALAGCAGSALLDDPPALERMVAAVVRAVPDRPVSAKIRAGGADDARLEELARAAESGGAALLSIHCRTRAEGYSDRADWRRIARAVAAVSIPVCGNGGVASHRDLARLREETGARYAMVGRAALGDPWIFSGRRVTRGEAAAFLLAYAEALGAGGSSQPGRARRVKQLLSYWTAGGLVADEADRRAWLREAEPARLLERLERARAEAPLAVGNEGRPLRSP